jgi:peptide/nickel transport system substrate-binding protein
MAESRSALWKVVVGAIVLVLLVALYQSFKPQKGDESAATLRIAIETEPERLDPLTVKNPKTFLILMQIYEGLLGLDETGRIVPAIAERWESADNGLTWRFAIRKNARFHESPIFGGAKSRPITSEDVAWSLSAVCGPGSYPAFVLSDAIQGCADFGAGKAKDVSGIKVVDGSTVEVTLIKPEAFFPYRLTTGWIAVLPREMTAPENKDKWGLSIAVGSGPYRLVSSSDSEVVLAANDAYWDSTRVPQIKKLLYRVIKNDQLRIAEMDKGAIDLMPLSVPMLPVFLDGPRKIKPVMADRYAFKEAQIYNTNLLGFNLNVVKDVHLRRAMFYGVDRKAIVEKLLYGYGDAMAGAAPPGMNGFQPSFKMDAIFDVERAKQELAKSTYAGEEIELFVHDLGGSEQIGQIFQDQMKSIGVKVKLNKLDMNGVIGRIIKGDAPMFSMFLDYVFSSPELVLLNLFPSSKRPVPNFWQYSSPEADARLERLRTMTGEAAVRESAQVEALIMEDVPALFLFRQITLVAHSKRLTKLSINGHGHYQFERAVLAQ